MAKTGITVAKPIAHPGLVEKHVDNSRFPATAEVCPLGAHGEPSEVESLPTGAQRDAAMLLSGAGPPWMIGPGTSLPRRNVAVRPVPLLADRTEAQRGDA